MKTGKNVVIPLNDSFGVDELPDGWEQVNLSQIAELIMGQSPPGTTYNTEGVGVPFFQGKSDFTEKSPVVRTWCTQPKKFAKAGDILISVRAPVGPTNVADRDCSIGRGLAAIRPKNGIPTEYILYYLKLKEPELALRGTGTTFTAIKKEDLVNLSIPLPPLAEQQRIVARVEALLAHSNAARDRLSRVPLIMKRFRRAVLAAACSGGLTDEPDGYQSRPAGDLFTDARYGTSNKCDYTKEDKIPVLRIPNIATGKLELVNLKYGDLTKTEIQRLAVQEGDLIICRTNGSLDLVGKAATIPHLSEQFVFASYLIRVRVNRNLLLPDYYHICLTGQVGRDHIEEMARSTAGQFNLNLEILRTMPIPLPPLANQHEIVLRVGTLFERADAIDREVVAASRRCEQLTQAVLGKAFSGSL